MLTKHHCPVFCAYLCWFFFPFFCRTTNIHHESNSSLHEKHIFKLAMCSSCCLPLKTANKPTIFTMTRGLQHMRLGEFVDCYNGALLSPIAKNASKHFLAINPGVLKPALLDKTLIFSLFPPSNLSCFILYFSI